MGLPVVGLGQHFVLPHSYGHGLRRCCGVDLLNVRGLRVSVISCQWVYTLVQLNTCNGVGGGLGPLCMQCEGSTVIMLIMVVGLYLQSEVEA